MSGRTLADAITLAEEENDLVDLRNEIDDQEYCTVQRLSLFGKDILTQLHSLRRR